MIQQSQNLSMKEFSMQVFSLFPELYEPCHVWLNEEQDFLLIYIAREGDNVTHDKQWPSNAAFLSVILKAPVLKSRWM